MFTEQSAEPNLEPRMSAAERHRVLVEFNDTQVDYPRDVCLHQLFEAQVSRTPDAVAVVFEGSQLTYAELDWRANQLARYLQTLGVGPEVLVGVFMERSLEMVLALYGILKAGGAYVPLDPEYPPERVAFMLRDTQVPVLLTQEHLLNRLPAHEAKVLCLDAGWASIGEQDTHPAVSGVGAENLAYVIYTSGSTGLPKGVMNCHRGICNRLLWMQDTYRLTAADRVVQKTPFSFDVSVWEFFWPLLFGAKLVVAKPGGHKDSQYLVDLVAEQGITTIHFVPSMLRLFLDAKDVTRSRSLKRVICSGEALSYDLQENFSARLGAELHNLYGPTEAAVDVTYWACKPGDPLGFVPIGRPVANTQIYVLDEEMEPVPIGVTGELHIGGAQVAKGYLNRPELTQARFVPDPFSSQPGAKLYKTGDLVSYLPSGDLKFLGRLDHQVKVRGNRIELGEIESVLEIHAEVKQAVVLAREDEYQETRLVAYMVIRPGMEAEIGELRSFLEAKLPDYMVPATFVMLDEMPLSPNGKVDRKALPQPAGERPQLGHAYVAPRDELECYLADVWCEILGLNRVGIHDRFFELGGSSLQAARFINRLQRKLGENIYIVSIFEAPTVAEYAAFLRRDYARSLADELGFAVEGKYEVAPATSVFLSGGKIDVGAAEQMRRYVFSLPASKVDDEGVKNPPALFILSPPRSGTTLLRAMLAGHPGLFAASELQLLAFNTLQERRAAYAGKFSLWLEGTIRAIMELRDCGADEAMCIMEACERQDQSTKQFYRTLQEWIGDRLLVDKSPSYALDLRTLERAERDFEGALYIHLVRHPYAMVRSFERYHMDQVLYLKPHPFSPRQLGELVWLVSHENIVQFLGQVPAHRQHQVHFEQLVRQPRQVMEDLCRKLSLEFHPNLLRPYDNLERSMIDGLHAESKPMGDTRFLEHDGINPAVAEAWRDVLIDDFLGEVTWEMAVSLGYEGPNPPRSGAVAEQREASTRRRRGKLLEQQRRRRERLRKDS